jgi:hypothetical protein
MRAEIMTIVPGSVTKGLLAGRDPNTEQVYFRRKAAGRGLNTRLTALALSAKQRRADSQSLR